MGLSGAFGNQNYKCTTCGHAMAEYAPHCPVCLKKTLSPQTKQAKHPGPSGTRTMDFTPDSGDDKAPPPPLAVALAVAILVLIAAVYVKFVGPQQPEQPVEVVRPVEPKPVVSSAPVRRAPPPRRAPRPVVRQASASTTTPGTAPRRGAPMKLWEASQDE